MTRYGYRLGLSSTAAHGTGNISATTTALTGSGTFFPTQIAEGSIIQAAGQTLCIASVTDNTNAVLVTAPSPAISGAAFDYVTMTNVESMGTNYQPPRSTFAPWVTTVDLGNATARAMGRASATWTWGFISLAQRNTLRTYCTGKSARVYVRTRTNDNSDAYVTYDAVMLWPDEEPKQAGRRFPFVLQFRDLILL